MSSWRAERTSPTSGAAWHWNTAAYRVMTPSTCSSKITSAAFSPVWGRAYGGEIGSGPFE